MNDLRELVARALFHAEFGDEFAWPNLPDWLNAGAWRVKADAVLAALGLDDLDAAVERAYEVLTPYVPLPPVRDALQAALTPPEEGA